MHQILFTGNHGQKVVMGRKENLTPVVIFDDYSEKISLGVQYDCGHGLTWGVIYPHRIIEFWRGMKILEQVPFILDGTIPACCSVGARKIDSFDQHYLDNIASQFGGMQVLQGMREEILNLAPPPADLDFALKILRQSGCVNICELRKELEIGTIKETPTIEAILKKAE